MFPLRPKACRRLVGCLVGRLAGFHVKGLLMDNLTKNENRSIGNNNEERLSKEDYLLSLETEQLFVRIEPKIELV